MDHFIRKLPKEKLESKRKLKYMKIFKDYLKHKISRKYELKYLKFKNNKKQKIKMEKFRKYCLVSLMIDS
jgi:hypothetical protein